MTIQKLDCVGCVDDFYNGKNDIGVEECFSFGSAVKENFRFIHINRAPPFNNIPIESKPKCYKMKGFVKVKPENITEDGRWK